jgi:hypothetical protein
MPASTARHTLERARFFLAEARNTRIDDQERLLHFFEAAIVFGRSVTFHLQSQHAHEAGFDAWYGQQQVELMKDSLARFFLEKRNYVLKVGQLAVGKHVDVHIQSTVHLTASVSAVVVRGKPWYRRSPRILIADVLYPLRQSLHSWRDRRRIAARARARESNGRVTVTESLRFADEAWQDRSALDLFHEYLDRLEPFVADAEKRFTTSVTARRGEAHHGRN